MEIHRATVVLAAVMVFGASMISGCAKEILGDTDQCGWLYEKPESDVPEAGQTAILIDVSNSTRGKDGKGSLNYREALKDEISDAAEAGDTVSIGVFDGSAATFQWIENGLITNRGAATPDNKNTDKKTSEECLGKVVDKAMATPPRTPGSDILGALDIAGEKVTGADHHGRIVLATDGYATVGCASLTGVDIGDADVVERISQRCKHDPHADLSKTNVVLLGVGLAAEGQVPSSSQLYSLAGLWERLCADLAGPDNCTVPLMSIRRSDSGPAADPKITDPPVRFRKETTETYKLELGTLFKDPNSFQVSSAGQQQISQIASQIKTSGMDRVLVHGYTEAEATPSENRQLAQWRADAVRAILVREGVTGVTTVAHEGTAPQCGQARRTQEDDEKTRQCRRRVDIVATTAG
ncbi:OmpA family protein [Amycolatopsis sp., V23-08]|uniref:OmpA family protein n=1 Tax=Amycolatopsis heterodermiae TaxID=3110235 RepID=A0ABU5RDX9_9PSEU|nr:OmpA family protein [Amycolatopsis sp., V23-08]MEA5364477.1 OmpA family protein [Amycolatopsis sp., V23-08]